MTLAEYVAVILVTCDLLENSVYEHRCPECFMFNLNKMHEVTGEIMSVHIRK
jgi:hypothetical protein